ncbi:hypothetical protein PYW08_013103 [Mythimna loreyi]|uniref:Uncharacterized protein n=1 Tax=Mythimna loreyi TaxID=667449 RepID=A0ACC2PZ37_9NEOP|nr:hypothetical protein PYW08_013103 [Mythimna loreyi]
MAKCAACGKYLSTKGGATCGNFACHNRYHLACLADAAPTGSDWLCPDCKSKLPKGDNSSTPVRGLGSVAPAALAAPAAAATVVVAPDHRATNKLLQTQGAPSRSLAAEPRMGSRAESEHVTDGEPSPDTQLTLREEIRLFRSELREVRDEMREFRREMSGLQSTVVICTERVDSLEARIEALETRQSAALHDAKVTQLEELVSQLHLELNDREQDLFSSDLEIANIPEIPEHSQTAIRTPRASVPKRGCWLPPRVHRPAGWPSLQTYPQVTYSLRALVEVFCRGTPEIPGENVVHTVGLVAAKLGLTLEERDIVFAQRVGLRA